LAKVCSTLESFARGEIGNGEVLSRIVAGLNRANIVEVVDALPEDWKAVLLVEFRQRVGGNSRDDLIDIVGGISTWEVEPDPSRKEAMRREDQRQRVVERERYWTETLPAIRWWLETQTHQ